MFQRKDISPSLTHVHEPLVRCADPETTISIAKQRADNELWRDASDTVSFCLSVSEPAKAMSGAEQEAVAVFDETPDAIPFAWHRMKLRRPRFPLPEPVRHPHPDTASAVLVKAEDDVAETAASALALNAPALNRAGL